MDTSGTKFFGVVAMSMGMVNRDQLQECLEAQEESAIPRRLGAIMRARGYLTERQVREILAAQGKTLEKTRQTVSKDERVKLLGEILVDCGHIDRHTLKAVIEQHELLCRKGDNPRLTRLLVSMGGITRAQIEDALKVLVREI